MRTFGMWMAEYGVSHQNRTNIIIHKICVPLIMWSVMGLLWVIPVPSLFSQYNLNITSFVALGAMAFYFKLSKKYFLFMIPVFSLMYYAAYAVEKTGHLLEISIGVFVVSWIFQFIGHKIEGKKPSFIQDLAFLLIGPLWVTKAIFRIED